MGNFIKYLVYMPAIIECIKKAIDVVEVPGYGPEKKAAVLALVKTVVEGFGLGEVERILGIAGLIVDGLVAFYNVVGYFKKQPAQA